MTVMYEGLFHEISFKSYSNNSNRTILEFIECLGSYSYVDIDMHIDMYRIKNINKKQIESGRMCIISVL